MKEVRALLVISNHHPDKWSVEQRAGWDIIEYIPFPDVDPRAGREEVMSLATDLIHRIRHVRKRYDNLSVCLQGEFTLCYLVYTMMPDIIFVFPTTERIATEIVRPDGSVEKTSKFVFVRWR